MKYKVTTLYTVSRTIEVEFESTHPAGSDEFTADWLKAERAALINANPNVDVDADIEIFETSYEEVK